MTARPARTGGFRTAGFLVAVLAVAPLSLGCHRQSPAPSSPAWSLEDPRGDDHGDGGLTYPMNGEPKSGELDLVALRAYPARDGTELELVFARKVRRPDARPVGGSGAGPQLMEVAPLGFYTMNVDLYVDVDRVPGSGHTDTLPGRKATIAPEFAWEKAILLTPDPHVVPRGVPKPLRGAVTSVGRVSVSRDSIRFFVPKDALPGGADPRYGYTVVVSGADLDTGISLSDLAAGRLFGNDDLAIMGVAPGEQGKRFGGREDDKDQPPIVDLLSPPGSGPTQEEQLRARPVVLRGVVPEAPVSAPPPPPARAPADGGVDL